MQKKDRNFKTFFEIVKTVKGKKRYLCALLFIHIFQATLSVGYALYFRDIIDSAVIGNREGMMKNIIGFAMLALIQLGLRSLSHFLTEYTRTKVENTFKKRLFKAILISDFSAVTAIHSGEWLNRLTSDVVIVSDGLISIIPGFAATVIRMGIAFIFLAYFIPGFALLLLVLGVFLIGFTAVFRKISKRLHVAVQKADGELRVFLTEQLNALMMVKSYGKEEQCADNAEDYMNVHRSKRMRRNHFSNITSSGYSFAMIVIRVLAVLYAGSAILTQSISYGTFTAIIQLLGQVQRPIASISGYAPRFFTMIASAERIFEIDDYNNDTSEENNFSAKDFYDKRLKSFGIKNASFSYKSSENDAKIILQDLNIDIEKGQFVAFAGRSGCGKSTVLKLFMSLYDLAQGSAYLVTDNGEIPLSADTRGLFAYVPQGNILMNSTIRDVVAFFDKNIDEEAVNRALKIACADEFVAKLPNGINTHLGERGAGLSEGEMQRIAIARAIYSDRPILLLDESTSALDGETEERLLRNIKTMTDKTVVIVTHRTKALSFVDRMIKFK